MVSEPMKLKAITESEVEVDIRVAAARVSAVVDGRKYELEFNRTTETGCVLRHEGRVFDCRIDGPVESGAPLIVTVARHRHALTLIDPKRLRSALAAGAHGEGAARISAPMPGKVVRVLVAPGQKVSAGDGILVVEAMKMQNEMKSPKNGIVTTVTVKVGVTVNGGDLLAVIE